MKERIKEIIDYKGISAGELADLLDVQRSNVSHILNGRNKPGAVFIERFLLSFPEVNARWLLTGKGNMLNSASANTNETANSKSAVPAPEINSKVIKNKIGSNVEKVILLYSDGTFSSYTPQ